MIEQQAIKFSITKAFAPVLNESFDFLKRDKEFKKSLKEKIEKDPRLESESKQTSIKIRYLLTLGARELKKKILAQEIERGENK